MTDVDAAAAADRLEAWADLLDKACEFMADPEHVQEAREEVALLRESASLLRAAVERADQWQDVAKMHDAQSDTAHRRAEATVADRILEAVAALKDDTLGLVGYVEVDSAHVRTLLAAWEAATAERDEQMTKESARALIAEADRWREIAENRTRHHVRAEAEWDRLAGHVTALRETLNRAQRDIVSIVLAGFDSTRSEIAARALKRIADALAGLDEPPELARENRCEHAWNYLPTRDSNPPLEARECVRCGVIEERMGLGYSSDGSPVEPTPWIARDDRSA